MTFVRGELPLSSGGGGGGASIAAAAAAAAAGEDATRERKEERFWDFELQYTPLRNGFVPVGGLRVLLLEDRVQGAEEAYLARRTGGLVVLKEWDVIGEIWVKS